MHIPRKLTKSNRREVLEIGNVVNVPGYERVYIGKYSSGSFTESSLHNLDRLDSDYINEHYGELQNEAYQQGMDDDIKYLIKCWGWSK